jgi:hypothetical protein
MLSSKEQVISVPPANTQLDYNYSTGVGNPQTMAKLGALEDLSSCKVLKVTFMETRNLKKNR